ncbi:MAG TPA: GAF domain-containing protein, partial [Chloroflexota bacterium]|nr:GAF domain-containing protein [Chloroflexota bacterium]
QLREMLTASEEREQATAEVLRVIAASPTDLDIVLTAICEAAARLCNAYSVGIQRPRPHDGRLAICALGGAAADRMTEAYGSDFFNTQRAPELNRETVGGRAFLDRQTITVVDLAEAAQSEFPRTDMRGSRERWGLGSAVSIPLLQHGESIGVLGLRRQEVRPFTDREIDLLETFADQAVIAIENARLFEELEQRNAELQESNRQATEALEQQTATAEVLRVIASSPTDSTTVLEAISSAAARLTGSDGATVLQLIDERQTVVAAYGDSVAATAAVARSQPGWHTALVTDGGVPCLPRTPHDPHT